MKILPGLYEACEPEILGERARPMVYVFQYLRGVVNGKINEMLQQTERRRHRQRFL